MGALPLPQHSGARVLHNMIYAMGAFDRARSETDPDGSEYYALARSALQEVLFDEGSLELVQGLAIMGNYLQRSNRPNAGYACLGLAIRNAIALGIHLPSAGTPLEQQVRTRTWWGLVTLEAGCSMTFGRPHILGPGPLTAMNPPLNIDDESLTVSDINMPVEAAHPTIYSALIYQSRLARTAFRLQDRISRSRHHPTVEQVKWCITEFQRDLPAPLASTTSTEESPFDLSSAVQSWRARDVEAILCRPILLSTAWSRDPQSALNPSVREIVQCVCFAQDGRLVLNIS